MGCGASQ
jgi:glutathione S-transferase